MNAQHTPGPWKALKTFGGVIHVMTEDDRSIAILRGYKHPHKANARLIAAAPDLLKALTAFPQSLAWTDDELWDWSKQALAAISKATGENNGSNP